MDFFSAASGQQRYPLLPRVKSMPDSKFLPRDLGRGRICQRMPHIAHLYSVPPVKLLLKGKDHNHFANIFLYLLYPPGTPSPYLRTDKIEDRNAKLVQLARKQQIKIRKIDQHRGIRLAPGRLSHQMLEAPANIRQVRQHLN